MPIIDSYTGSLLHNDEKVAAILIDDEQRFVANARIVPASEVADDIDRLFITSESIFNFLISIGSSANKQGEQPPSLQQVKTALTEGEDIGEFFESLPGYDSIIDVRFGSTQTLAKTYDAESLYQLMLFARGLALTGYKNPYFDDVAMTRDIRFFASAVMMMETYRDPDIIAAISNTIDIIAEHHSAQ